VHLAGMTTWLDTETTGQIQVSMPG
jgi:hypothetical protein